MALARRTLLEGLGTAALLSPFLALERAAAQVKANAEAAGASEHLEHMAKVIGPGLNGEEQIAMLLYPGFTALDLVGPHYFFACLFGAKVHLVTPGKARAPVASDLGLAIAPTATLAECPKNLDLVFVPGGTEGTLAVMKDKRILSWLSDRAARARHITSVCTGAMVLAKAGLLKGKRATSHWAVRPALADFGATPIDARVVTDGNVTTGAGVSAGLDFGIALVAALRGKAYAEALMLQAEYRPEPPFAGGSLDSTAPEVREVMREMLSPLEAQFRALARS